MIWLIFLKFFFAQTFGVLDTPLTVTLNGDAQPVDVVYRASEGEQVSVTAHSLGSESIDVTLEILRDNQRLAFNDDHQTEREGLGAQDSVIENFVFPTAGDYIIRVNSFNGAQNGDIEVTIESIPLNPPCQTPLQGGEVARNGEFTCTLSLDSDSAVTISVRDTSGTLDPVLTILNEDSTQAAYNDDHDTENFVLNTLDSQVSDFALSGGENYVVRVADFSGAAGTFELRFTITP